MRLNSILLAFGSVLALATAAPAFGWSQGWDWDEDFVPTQPTLDPVVEGSDAPLQLEPGELDALAEPLCAESPESGSCTIHA